VLLEHGGAGGQVAWPVAKQILEGYFTKIHPSSPPPRDMPAVKRAPKEPVIKGDQGQ